MDESSDDPPPPVDTGYPPTPSATLRTTQSQELEEIHVSCPPAAASLDTAGPSIPYVDVIKDEPPSAIPHATQECDEMSRQPESASLDTAVAGPSTSQADVIIDDPPSAIPRAAASLDTEVTGSSTLHADQAEGIMPTSASSHVISGGTTSSSVTAHVGGDPGPFSRAEGLSFIHFTNPQLAKGKIKSFKTGLVLELFDFCNNKKDVADMMFVLAHDSNSIHHSKPDSVRVKVGRAVQKRKTLRKNKKSALPAFLDAVLIPPIPATRPPTSDAPSSLDVEPGLDVPPTAKRTLEDLDEENAAIKEEVKNLESRLKSEVEKAEQLGAQLKRLVKQQQASIAIHAKDVSSLAREMTKVTKEYDRQSQELDRVNNVVEQLRGKVAQKAASLKNISKRLRRSTEKQQQEKQEIQELKESKRQLEQETQKMSRTIEDTTELLSSAKKEKRTALRTLSQVKRRTEQRKADTVFQNESEIKRLKEAVASSNTRIAELEQLNVILEDEMIHTFEGGKYVNELRETIMILLTECNVSMSKIKKVINTVCKNLLGKLPERLPSLGTLDRILSEAKFVAQNQIFKCMEEGGDPTKLTGNTLHNDATTKFHHHYQGFQVTLLNGKQMTIGLREVGAADTDTLMDAFTSTIEEITAAVSDSTTEKQTKIAGLISSLKNTMGDQGPTNPQFNTQVQTLRETLLPKVVDNWDQLNEDNKKEMANMGNFFCKMHLLVNFATEGDKVLKINEGDIVAEGKNPYAYGSESGAARLVRTAAKAFTSHGCDKSGMASDWETYLQEQGKTNPSSNIQGQPI
eukprot:XP_011661343.1 PREDICTED: uncharacterized protein LOC105436956 isoform X1 [Strongylocentrotus purpuratus]